MTRNGTPSHRSSSVLNLCNLGHSDNDDDDTIADWIGLDLEQQWQFTFLASSVFSFILFIIIYMHHLNHGHLRSFSTKKIPGKGFVTDVSRNRKL